jgi:predicted AAA+ superfamily ATPase
MDLFREQFLRKLSRVSVTFVRSFMNDINWNSRLIGIKGARGIGKTTIMLQYIKMNLSEKIDQTLYVSLDSMHFSNYSLMELVREFDQQGGKYLFLDEVHKYENWSQELKNCYDDYPDMQIVFTGSSLLEILNARADLSRRAVVYLMQGFSFREYLALETGIPFEIYSLDDICNKHEEICRELHTKIRPFMHFDTYLRQGYYPYYKEQEDLYSIRLGEVLNLMLEIELPLLRQVDIAYIGKVRQLLRIIAESVPFVPNVSKISEKIALNRGTMLQYLHYLGEIGITYNLMKEGHGISRLQKPNKIYLENTNLIYLLARENANEGNVRETFFANQLKYKHSIHFTPVGDFLVDGKLTFEIGGKNKTKKQIDQVPNAFIAADSIEFGYKEKIPLWLFGFLY